MRAIFTGSTSSPATAKTPPPPPPIPTAATSTATTTATAAPGTATTVDSGTNNSYTSPGSSSPTTPSVSVSSPDDPFPRRVKSKSSLRSVRSFGSSHHDDDACESPDQSAGSDNKKTLVRPSFLHRLSPGLAARVKLLDGSNKSANNSRNPSAIGRIPQEHIKELDSLHQNLSVKIEKKGRSWNVDSDKGQPQQQQQQPLGDSLMEDPVPALEPTAPVLSEPSESLPPSSPDRLAATPIEPTPEEPYQHHPPTSAADKAEQNSTATMSVTEPAPAPVISDPEPDASNTADQTDFEKYIQDTENEDQQPPPPPPKDSSRPASSASSTVRPFGLHRTESIYSFSRASFSNQLSQLTSISLPQPSALETSIMQIPNAPKAVRALTGASDQIQIWIKKASDVLSGMDAEDDVEWAAAGGREGLDGVDNAIKRFEGLVNVYVKAIEDVQLREDINEVGPDSLQTIVVQMEAILQSWAQIKARLRGVKEQVELAMEWEELWGSVLGDVGMEVENLSQLIFEMEEKRHWTMSGADQDSHNGLDINELETIVEETPSNGNTVSNKRFSMGPIYAAPPTLDTPLIQTPQDDTNHSNLMGLFARMQPLRASLEFLPMRMSMFQARAESVFPSACEELEDRRAQLEQSYKVLESDAEAVRKELSEDRWILVFRNAGNQAHKMFDSVERSIAKLQEGLETGAHLHNPAGLAKRVESYEAKKLHYVPAIERVCTIVQKGVSDRLTVNGETLRLLSDMKSRTDALKASIKVMDESLEDISFTNPQHLRDSISSIVTLDSPATNSVADTPGSSPASSVVLSGNAAKGSSTPMGTSSRRGSSVGSTARTTMSKTRRFSGIPQPATTTTTTTTTASKKSAIPKPTVTAPSPAKPNVSATPTPAGRRTSLRPTPSPLNNRPRWSSSTNTNDLDVGHYKPYSQISPSFRKSSAPPPRTSRPASTLPFSTPRRDLSASPAPPRSVSRFNNRLSRSPGRNGSPTPPSSILDPPPYSKLRKPAPSPAPSQIPNTPRNRQSFAGTFSRSVSRDPGHDRLSSPTKSTRPGTALGHSANRRTSLLPLPKAGSGRESAAGTRSKLDQRPRWR